jgi:hypothetical protein
MLYLCQLHAANVGIKSEKLESLRISIAKGSPMWETLDSCIKVVDAESLDTLIPRLAHLVRSGVGLNTRSVYLNCLLFFMHFPYKIGGAYIDVQRSYYKKDCGIYIDQEMIYVAMFATPIYFLLILLLNIYCFDALCS